MKVKTHLFGEVNVSDDKIITFPKGLIGFEDKTKFMLVHEENISEQQGHFSYTLQSVEVEAGSNCAEYALQIIDPTIFGIHYELELTDEESNLLKNPKSEDVAFMQIVYKVESQDNQEKSKQPNIATNLRAPLIINLKERVGIQKLIEKVNTNLVFSNLTEEV